VDQFLRGIIWRWPLSL